jgi:hypothetical protein
MNVFISLHLISFLESKTGDATFFFLYINFKTGRNSGNDFLTVFRLVETL